VISLATEQS